MGRVLLRRRAPLIAAIDPSTQPLTWWARAPYTYASTSAPITGLTTTGTSGSKVIGYGGAPPTRTGYALNGLEGMAGEGHHDSLFDAVDGTHDPIGAFLSRTAYTVGFLLKAGAPNDNTQNEANEYPVYCAATTPADARYHRAVVSDGGLAKWSLNYVPNGGVSGLYTLCHFDGTLKTVAVEGALEEVCLIQAGFTGTNIWIQKDDESPVTLAAGPIIETEPGDWTNAGWWHEMDAFTAAHFGGVIWDRWASDQNLYAQRDGFRLYVNQRYGLSL